MSNTPAVSSGSLSALSFSLTHLRSPLRSSTLLRKASNRSISWLLNLLQSLLRSASASRSFSKTSLSAAAFSSAASSGGCFLLLRPVASSWALSTGMRGGTSGRFRRKVFLTASYKGENEKYDSTPSAQFMKTHL